MPVSRACVGIAVVLTVGALACQDLAVVEPDYSLVWLAAPPDSIREGDSAAAEVELRDGGGQRVTTFDGATVELRLAYQGADSAPGTACGLVCPATVAQGRAAFSLAWISAGGWTVRACAPHPAGGEELCAEHALQVLPVHAALVIYPGDSVGRRVRFPVEARLRLPNGVDVADQVRTVRLRFTSSPPEPADGRVRCPEAGPMCERPTAAGVVRLDSVMVVDTGSTVLAACVVAPNGRERCDPAGARQFRVVVPPAVLRFLTQPMGGSAGVPFTAQPAIEALEPDGTRRSEYNEIIEVAIGTGAQTGTVLVGTGHDGAPARGRVTARAASGVATLADLRVTHPGGGYTLVATAPPALPETSQAFVISLDPSQLDFAKHDGDGQYRLVGTTLPIAPTVRVVSPLGDPISGVAVSFVTEPGNGSVLAGLATTDADGLAGCGAWTLGAEVGLNQLVASMTGRSVAFSAEGVEWAALDFVVGPHDVVAGEVISPPMVVDLLDHAGRRLLGAQDTVVLKVYDEADLQAEIELRGMTRRAAVDGRATFDDVSLPPGVGGAFQMDAYRASDSQSEISVNFRVPVVVASLAFRTPPTDVVVGDVMSPAVEIALLDRDGRSVSGATDVVLVRVNGGGVLGTTERAAENGLATFDDLIMTSGDPGGEAFEMWAELLDRPEVSVPLAASFQVFSRGLVLRIAGDGQNTAPGTAVPVAPTVRVENRDGVPVAGVPVTFTVTLGGGSVTDPVQVTGDDGRASPGAWILGPALGLNHLRASAEWFEPVTFTAYAGEPSFAANLISAGYDFTCATSAGTDLPYCWGDNTYGQLGDGTQSARNRPNLLAAGLIDMTQMAAGLRFACGLRPDGAAYCWGDNSLGQLGTGNRDSIWIPALVSGGHAFERIATGASHACALAETGAAWCWGAWQANGLSADTALPVAVTGLHQFTQIVTGAWHSCGLDTSGEAWCWGDNTYGQLSDSTVAFASTTPVRVRGGRTYTRLSAGAIHTCGISNDAVYCWGSNSAGQMGNGSTSFTPVFTPVPTLGVLGSAFHLAAGGSHTCAATLGLDNVAEAYCWGLNDHGQLGDGTTDNRTSGTLVAGGIAFATITAGAAHTCATQVTGASYCWGWNYLGRLGNGSFAGADVTAPAPVAVP
jgi:hypothetical protein